METLGKITLSFIMIVVVAICTSLVGAYVILQIAQIYNIIFIKQFTYIQIYGILVVINLLRKNHSKDKKEEKSYSSFMLYAFGKLFTDIIEYLTALFFASLVFEILTYLS